MKEHLLLDATGMNFSPLFARKIVSILGEAHIEADEVQLTPLQMAAVENSAITITDVKVVNETSADLKTYLSTLCGIPIKQDVNCEPSSIFFKRSGEIVGEIRNLAVPVFPTQDSGGK
jgi:hypothetical protein